MKKLNSLLGFPKIKAVELSNGKWITKVKKFPLATWEAVEIDGTSSWKEPKHIQDWCLFPDEESAMAMAVKFAFPKPTFKDEIKKAMK